MIKLHPQIHIDKPRVSPLRSLIKTIGYRVISASETMALAGFMFGDWHIAMGFGIIDMLGNTVLYYFHERAWAHIDLHLNNRQKRKDNADNV